MLYSTDLKVTTDTIYLYYKNILIHTIIMNRSKPYSHHHKVHNEFKPLIYKKINTTFTMTDGDFPDLFTTTTTSREKIQEKQEEDKKEEEKKEEITIDGKVVLAEEEEQKIEERKNYMEAALKEKPLELMKNNTLPEGWIGYYYNDEKKVVKVDNSQKYEEYNEEDESKTEQIACYNALLRNLLQYQIYYDELNGEGEYERVYSMKEDKYTLEEE